MQRPEIHLVPITLADLHSLHRLSIDTFEPAFAPNNTPENMAAYMGMAFSEEKLRSELQNPDSLWFFAKVDSQPVGYLKLNLGPAQTELQNPDALEIERIYVLPEYYKAGVGQVLLDKAVEVGRSRSLAYVWLGVWERNPRAIRFYEKNGFQRFGEHPFWMGTDKQTDWLMRKEI